MMQGIIIIVYVTIVMFSKDIYDFKNHLSYAKFSIALFVVFFLILLVIKKFRK